MIWNAEMIHDVRVSRKSDIAREISFRLEIYTIEVWFRGIFERQVYRNNENGISEIDKNSGPNGARNATGMAISHVGDFLISGFGVLIVSLSGKLEAKSGV